VLELWDVGTLTLGLRPKQGLAGGRAKRKPGVTFHAPGNVRKCEGINSHTPKRAPTLGVGVPMDFQILESDFRGQNLMD
jgi:hypothetical protein